MILVVAVVQEAEARAAEASEQLEQAQARTQAIEQQLAQESELRSIAEQRAADQQAAREALEADGAAQGGKVSFLCQAGIITNQDTIVYTDDKHLLVTNFPGTCLWRSCVVCRGTCACSGVGA